MPGDVKTLLVAHRDRIVRDRFRAALADARHACVSADTETAAAAILASAQPHIDLAVVDFGLSGDGFAWLERLRRHDGSRVPFLVFSGSVSEASDIPSLSAAGALAFINEHAPTPQIVPALAPHLFPDNFNRRASPRVTVGIPISYRTSFTLAGAVTLDVGKGGIAVRTMTPPSPGEGLTLKFRLPGTTTELEASGRVAWANQKVGMGVQFELVTPEAQAAIDTFVDDADEDPGPGG